MTPVADAGGSPFLSETGVFVFFDTNPEGSAPYSPYIRALMPNTRQQLIMKKTPFFTALLFTALIATWAPRAEAALSAFDAFVSIDGTFYDVDNDVAPLDAFAGQTFTIGPGDPLLMGGDVKTAPGGGVAEGADEVVLLWKVFDVPNALTPNAQAYGFDSNPSAGVDKWTATAGTGIVDVASGLALGDYTLEIFWRAIDFGPTGDFAFVNNGEANYSATISVIPPIGVVGDYNGNAIVDAADYTVWRDSFGSTTNLAADGDSSGEIDAGDYTVWVNRFGESSTFSATVPEPTALLVLGMTAAGLCFLPRYRRGFLGTDRMGPSTVVSVVPFLFALKLVTSGA